MGLIEKPKQPASWADVAMLAIGCATICFVVWVIWG